MRPRAQGRASSLPMRRIYMTCCGLDIIRSMTRTGSVIVSPLKTNLMKKRNEAKIHSQGKTPGGILKPLTPSEVAYYASIQQYGAANSRAMERYAKQIRIHADWKQQYY